MFLYLEFTWHDQLWGVHTDEGVHATEEKNGQDDRKVTDEFPHLQTQTSQVAFLTKSNKKELVRMTQICGYLFNLHQAPGF